MNTEVEAGKSRRLKVIIVTIVAAIIILLVGIWAISSALNSSKKEETGDHKPTEVATKTEEKTTTGVSNPADQYTSDSQAQEVQNNTVVPTPAPAVSSEDIPTTGPSDILISALGLGVVAYLAVFNLQLVKKNN